MKGNGFNWKATHPIMDSYTAAVDIINFFKQCDENNKRREAIVGRESRKLEKMVQGFIHGQASLYVEANGFDISCEPDEGRRPVDFKISRGQDKTLIEVKLSSNPQYLHGYEVRTEEYGKAESTNKLLYVLINLGHPEKVKKVQDLHDKHYNDGFKTPGLIVIDSTAKESARKTRQKRNIY